MIYLKALSRIATIACLCFLYTLCPAQDKAKNTWGKIVPADFTPPARSAIVDSSTGAVILSDLGDVHFIGNDKQSAFSYVFKRQTRIKVLHKEGFDLDKVLVDLYVPDEAVQKISKVDAVTYNLENGVIVPTKLDPKDIFQERRNKYYVEAKFSLPGIKDGSIIEYTYTVTSSYHFRLPAWQFQWEKYPCLWSEYQVEIPSVLMYTLVRQGVHPYTVDKGSEGHAYYKVVEKAEAGTAGYGSADQNLNVSANTVKHDWAMKDIPAFGNEPYVTTADNYVDRLTFQLSKTTNGEQTYDVANNWATLTGVLLSRADFGVPLEADADRLAQITDQITAGENDPLLEAK